MNSAINYYSAAQRHADAIREARRNPPAVFGPARTHSDAEKRVFPPRRAMTAAPGM